MMTDEEYGAQVNIVVGVFRAVYDHGSKKPTGILGAVVRMIPAGAIKICLERVRKGASRCNRALLYGRTTSREMMGTTTEDLAGDLHAVIPRRLFLQYPMPMHPGTFFWAGDLVMDGDHESVSPIGLECGRRELSIDQ